MNLTTNDTTVWLVRHGLPEGVEGRCHGRLDVPLSAEGIVQARETAARLAEQDLSAVYSSGLRRAIETARILADRLRLDIRTMEGLAEIDFGDFEGMTYEDIQQQYPEAFESWMRHPAEAQFPNGESLSGLAARVNTVLDSLLSRHRNESIAVVAHSGVIRYLVGQALSMPKDQIFRLSQRYGALNRIRYSEHGPIVELVNG
ncbi:MAG TPA: alpha-ribazole phosphatase [Terriglobia bacterium]|jgi:alpha-ribazole phosphatase